MEYTFAVFKLNADIMLFICPVQTNMSSKLIYRSLITNSFLSGIGMHSTFFERNIVSSFLHALSIR
ncbi:hypothetical protein AXW38_06105 [Yersinia ruckeri]|nr:hypothetical protein AXW20_06110 [Yersinia ruckeri]OIX35762.1 hypothetical protein AXW19_06095 [Yersinia ruckeri]OIX35849.1 hypothetical protein AXW18_06105 [Yersinia ruckeri]OIX45873.1 hypothetical protein AXW21_06110 [Yersinia ruckeri]OIX45880.1 hypothetical protein AXW23_06090 [Yersinia ruckeri]